MKSIRNLFRLKKENYAIKDMILRHTRNYFRLEKEYKTIKKIQYLRDFRNIFEDEEEENYYKPVRISSFWSNNYIEYESNDDRNKTLSIKEYLNKIRTYLKDIKNIFKKFDTLKFN